MTRRLVVFGDNTADEILSALGRIKLHGFDQICKHFFDRDHPNRGMDELASGAKEVAFVVGIADATNRAAVAEIATQRGWRPFTVVDPTAVVDPSATLEPGCFVAAQAAVSCRAHLGRHTLVHFHATIGHDTRIGDHSVILPGARISGKVSLGSGVLIGSNAFIYQGIRIGDGASVDALTYVRQDVPPYRVVSVRSQPIS